MTFSNNNPTFSIDHLKDEYLQELIQRNENYRDAVEFQPDRIDSQYHTNVYFLDPEGDPITPSEFDNPTFEGLFRGPLPYADSPVFPNIETEEVKKEILKLTL